MTTRRRTPAQTLAQKSLELSIAAPQVVAQRLARMALAGARPSARDQKEFLGMGVEKVVAFQQSWVAMWSQLARAQAEAVASLYMAPLRGSRRAAGSAVSRANHTAAQVLAAGIAPVHAKAVANAKRLSRKR